MAKVNGKNLLKFLGMKQYPFGGLTWPANLDFIFREAIKKGADKFEFSSEELSLYFNNLKSLINKKDL